MNKNYRHFSLFSCCKLVKGYLKCLIYDIQRQEYHVIPNSLADILTLYPQKTIPEIKKLYSAKCHSIIDNYFQYLFDKELAFPCDDKDLSCYPSINTTLQTPCIIDNFILDIDKNSHHDYETIFMPLSQMILRVIQLRFFNQITINDIKKILCLVNNTDIRAVELIVPYNNEINHEKWIAVGNDNIKLTACTIYNSPKSYMAYNKQAKLIYVKENITSHHDCGKISKNLFSCNLKTYNESLQYNTCLNGKASIDTNGEIKNCPGMKISFGNYKNVSLFETIQKPEFQFLWTIKKDEIETCKDCEFRYMCTDCRAYIKDPDNIYSQPLKCTYNPYIAKWENENEYYSVEEWIQKAK